MPLLVPRGFMAANLKAACNFPLRGWISCNQNRKHLLESRPGAQPRKTIFSGNYRVSAQKVGGSEAESATSRSGMRRMVRSRFLVDRMLRGHNAPENTDGKKSIAARRA